MKHIIQLFSGVMEDIQEKAKFKMKNKEKEAMESWRELHAKVRDIQRFRDVEGVVHSRNCGKLKSKCELRLMRTTEAKSV